MPNDQGGHEDSKDTQQRGLQPGADTEEGAAAPSKPASHPPPFPASQSHQPLPRVNSDLLQILEYFDLRRREDDYRRREEEEARRCEENRRRKEEEDARKQEEDARKQAEDARMAAFIQALANLSAPPGSLTQDPSSTGTGLQHTPTPGPAAPKAQKAITQLPPPLAADATFQTFREWRRRWTDYARMVDLATLPREKQLIQMRMCLTLDMQGTLERTIGIPPDTSMPVDEILDALQEHIKNSRNEVLRRRDLINCRQHQGETFDQFHARVQRLAEEVDVCATRSVACEEVQIRTVIMNGLRNEELVQKLLSTEKPPSLQETIKICKVFEAAKTATSDICAQPAQACAVSAYRKDKRDAQRTQPLDPAPPTATGDVCRHCSSRHGGDATCPAANATCRNCNRKGHRTRAPVCPATNAECRHCHRTGHYDKCCRQKTNSSPSRGTATPNSTTKTSECRRVESPSKTTSTTPVNFYYKGTNTQLHMLPDTGADVTVIGRRHLDTLQIPTSCLRPPPAVTTLNADGTPMAPALGTLQATLSIGKLSCIATILVHEDIATPLLSRSHCKVLAVIPQGFPRPILSVEHVSRCKALPFSTATTPLEARAYFLQEFQDVLVSKDDLLKAPLRPMKGPPMKIHLREDAVPFAIHTPRQIPFAFRDKVKAELDSLVAQGIIRPAGDKPSDWCHPLVVVPKNTNGVRLTVDLTKLNNQISRPAHPSPTPFAAIRSVGPKARYFTTVDALCGYWQMELAEEDQHLTTFITPYGRFQHCRGPMGFAATGDAFCLRGDMALQGIQNCTKVVDDVLIYDEDLATHLQRTHDVLLRCREFGITLNKDKFVVAAQSVKFCGYTISEAGISADQEKVSAIRDFPTPANITDLRSFMGLVNQLADFTPDIAATARPLRPLMSPKRAFIWTADHDESFRQVKAALLSPPVLAPFDPSKPVLLQTDASRLNGIGYALLQDHGGNTIRLVQCGSRFLSDTEARYATIELELLAVVWAVSKCKVYLIGLQHFTLVTDHRPLIPILNTYSLDAVENPRLQRLKEKMSPFLYTAVWRAGKELCIPDALSRAPVSHPTPEDELGLTDAAAHIRAIMSVSTSPSQDEPPSQDADLILQELREAASTDPIYTRLRQSIISGFPSNRYDLHTTLLPFWKIRDNLSVDGDLVLYGARVVIPEALRRRTLARLHDSHRGTAATKRRASQTVFWPGINSDIANTVQACEPCQMLQPSQQQEPLLNDDIPTRPFESVSADFFHVAGKAFLVITDRLSGWPTVTPCKGDTTASNTVRMFCRYFREVGVPLRLRTDRGPQFTSIEFQNFVTRWGVRHLMSSPHYPQANGHAEAAVKSVKHLILKTSPSGNIDCEEFDRGLLELRNTPNSTGRSPAQILFGRPLRSCVPAHPHSFAAEWQAKAADCDRRAAARAETVRSQYDQHARLLPRLKVGETVRIQDHHSHRWDRVGIVMGLGKSREYLVRLPSGAVWWRNRRFLRPVKPLGKDPPHHTPVAPCTDLEKESLAYNPPKSPRRSSRLTEKEPAQTKAVSVRGEGGVDI